MTEGAVAEVRGPSWTEPGSGKEAGRFPLAVERHLIAHVGRLLPGVTSVTPHGRYYAAHGLVAHEASERGLADIETRDLLRRTEVALAAVSLAHRASPRHRKLNQPHGVSGLTEAFGQGTIDVQQAAGFGAGRYAKAKWGFLGPYRASETLMKILGDDDTKGLEPGPSMDRARVEAGLQGLLDLAQQDKLTASELEQSSHLCMCAGADAEDGLWLAELLAPNGQIVAGTVKATRSATIKMITRLMDQHYVADVTNDLADLVAFGSTLRDDDVLAQLDEAHAWRGVIFRWHSVNAWRRLWAWLVAEINGVTPRSDLADCLAEALPNITVGSFVRQLPSLMDSRGDPAGAERDAGIAEQATPLREISLLAIGSLRLDHITNENVSAGFQGLAPQEKSQELAPKWMAEQLQDWHDRSLQDFGRQLSEVMINRSQRLALQKSTPDRSTGILKIPSRVFLRDEGVYKNSDEGAASVGLRWPQLATVLAEAGVIEFGADSWRLTDRGRHVLA